MSSYTSSFMSLFLSLFTSLSAPSALGVVITNVVNMMWEITFLFNTDIYLVAFPFRSCLQVPRQSSEMVILSIISFYIHCFFSVMGFLCRKMLAMVWNQCLLFDILCGIFICSVSLRSKTRLSLLTGCGQDSYLQLTSQASWALKSLLKPRKRKNLQPSCWMATIVRRHTSN